jgi:hypothetical protein
VTPLLHIALDVRGGFKRWAQIRTITVPASITRATWAEGQADYLYSNVKRVDTQRQQIVTDFRAEDERLTYGPARVTLVMPKGHIRQERRDPKHLFFGRRRETARLCRCRRNVR